MSVILDIFKSFTTGISSSVSTPRIFHQDEAEHNLHPTRNPNPTDHHDEDDHLPSTEQSEASGTNVESSNVDDEMIVNLQVVTSEVINQVQLSPSP